MTNKLYLIGIDSAPLWMVRDNIEERRLRGFESLLGNGVLMDLESTMPPMTGPSWPSIYTGFKPGEHGVPEFQRMERNYSKSVVFYDPSIRPPFWDMMAEHGLRSLVVTPAMLVKPSAEKNVDMITGFPLPAKFSSPWVRGIAMRHSYKGEPDEIEMKMKRGEYTLAQGAHDYLKGIEKRVAVSKELMAKKDYDMSFICFTEQDRMQHFALGRPEWKEYVMPLYEAISDFMLWVEARAERERATVMVVSDHGGQPIREKLLMNGWLIGKGYAHLQGAIEKELESASAAGSLRYNIRERVLKSVQRGGSRKVLYDRLPPALKGVAKSTISRLLPGVGQGDYVRIHDFDLDMGRTRAFASIANCPVATIYINDGRFDHGIVSAKEKPALKRRIMRELLGIKGKDGKPIIIKTYDADRYYEGTKLFIAPDIFAEAREGYLLDSFGYLKSGGLFMAPEAAKSGDHLRNGIFGVLSYGERLDYRAIAKRKLYVYNIEPTIMKYFGLEPRNDKRYGPIF